MRDKFKKYKEEEQFTKDRQGLKIASKMISFCPSEIICLQILKKIQLKQYPLKMINHRPNINYRV